MNELYAKNPDEQPLEYNPYPHPRVIAILKIFTISAGYFVATLSLIDLLGSGFDLLTLEAPKDPLLAVTFLSLACALIFSCPGP